MGKEESEGEVDEQERQMIELVTEAQVTTPAGEPTTIALQKRREGGEVRYRWLGEEASRGRKKERRKRRSQNG